MTFRYSRIEPSRRTALKLICRDGRPADVRQPRLMRQKGRTDGLSRWRVPRTIRDHRQCAEQHSERAIECEKPDFPPPKFDLIFAGLPRCSAVLAANSGRSVLQP